MKSTFWTELDFEHVTIIERAPNERSFRISHPDLVRPLWFVLSKAGNLYWRSTRTGEHSFADAYIIKNHTSLDFLFT